MVAFQPHVHVGCELCFETQAEFGKLSTVLRACDIAVLRRHRGGVISVVVDPVGFGIGLPGRPRSQCRLDLRAGTHTHQ